MRDEAASIAFWVLCSVSSLALFPPAVVIFVVTWPFDRRRYVLHRFTSWWASLFTRLTPRWRVVIEGRDHIDDDRAQVLVSNHLSLVDILVLFRLFKHFKWVSKHENFRVPVIGWNMSMNGYIPLRRGDRDSVALMLERCRQTLAHGSSIMMFPEGTRSRDGILKPFKAGAFQLALECQVDVVPIVVQGTREALPKRGFLIHPARIRVTVLPPLPHAAFAGQTAEEVAERVRAVMAEFLAREGPPSRNEPA